MATGTATGRGVAFRVLDAMDAPHSGRILRLRLHAGEAPSVRALRGARLKARAPDGRSCTLKVVGFALVGGKPSDVRLARTGRVDVRVEEIDGQGPVDLQWEIAFEG
ncbi:MAG: hypothetical protein FIA95_12550 [Gemmatimonadetes bacterium]|nr:hypothetical protein [Gemmatimonadota bacterium]